MPQRLALVKWQTRLAAQAGPGHISPMENVIEIGDPPIAVAVVRSTRARRFSLRVPAPGQGPRLTVPARAPMDQALAFLRGQEPWLRRNMAQRPAVIVPDVGATVPVDGTQRRIVALIGRSVRLGEDTLAVPATAPQVPARVRAFLKTHARDRLVPASARYATQIGRPLGRVTLRDTRSRWGSCTSDGNLMYSWRLAMAPRSVQEYVAAHEVCHLAEMNHGPGFWALVAELFPEWRRERDWLRVNGAALHRYQF
ncbi:MAG: SprT family zinc-dependent metalloprotease [Pseudomonadota bacterium]